MGGASGLVGKSVGLLALGVALGWASGVGDGGKTAAFDPSVAARVVVGLEAAGIRRPSVAHPTDGSAT